MKKNQPKWTIRLMDVAKFKFSFPLTRAGTQVADQIKMTKTKEEK